MKSLARALGVSVTTVSNAYSHPERLSAELRARILATGEHLGYSGPDAAGRLLRSGRAMTVGVLCGDGYSFTFDDHLSAALLRGISCELERAGVALQLLSSGPDEQDADAVARAAVDAIICLTARTDTPPVLLARRRGIPVVHTSPVEDAAHVAIDTVAGAHLLAGALAADGHTSLVVVGAVGDPELTALRAGFPGEVRHLPCALDAPALMAALSQTSGATALVAADASIATRLDSLLAASPASRLPLVCLDIPDSCWENHLSGVLTPVMEQGRACARLALDPDRAPRQVLLPVRLQPGAAATRSGPHEWPNPGRQLPGVHTAPGRRFNAGRAPG